jgi:hypothetical protein
MLPVILVSPSRQSTDRFVEGVIADRAVPAYNVFRIEPPKREVTIDQIRELKRQLVSADTKPRLFVIYSFDSASQEAQNALLKTLEEKNSLVEFILEVGNAFAILPTIRSRATTVSLTAEGEAAGLSGTIPLVDAALAGKITVLSHPEATGMTTESAPALLDRIALVLRDRLSSADGAKAAAALKDLLATKELLINNNLNPQLAVDGLLLRMGSQ